MKKYAIISLFALCFSFLLISCDDHDIDPGGTTVEKMAGDWLVELRDANGENLFGGTARAKFYTYNTAANVATEMFIDNNNTLPLKGKVQVDYKNRIFFTNDFVDNYYAASDKKKYPFKIYEGKVLEGAGRTLSGMPADSIYLKFECKDKPGSEYVITGIRRTGFLADDNY